MKDRSRGPNPFLEPSTSANEQLLSHLKLGFYDSHESNLLLRGVSSSKTRYMGARNSENLGGPGSYSTLDSKCVDNTSYIVSEWHILGRQPQRAVPFASMTSSPTVSAAPSRTSLDSPLQHNELQLWLREQLSKVPFFQPIIQKMTQAEQLAAASDTSSASGGIGGEQARAARGFRLRAEGNQNRIPNNIKPDEKPLWDMFVEMDLNGDGTIDLEEMRAALMKIGLPCSPHYVEQMFQQCNRGSTTGGVITWENFRQYVKRREDQIEAAFSALDFDGNGEISASELGRAMANAGLPTTGRDIRKVMEVLNKGTHDIITYDEFRRWACMVPSWQAEGQRMNSYTVWLRNAPTTAQAMRRQQTPASNRLLDDPLRPFAIFDLMLRVSLAGTLGLMVLVALRQD
ncbi:hypothetical protein CEUSTIGMA_g4482.t1 [Chlamydomonas eustigma]|uniref:EF-hand domain-containing protein n=1 Tax=Chlamydomonas eustigma TaxID=1157962 RepID=A0A250X1V4_9CHLO|nr:hypothetical protein CEUSTIGMA_g4482.t1 [Chlamydomonas eustigma]|eukprot:GAX77035.1 hypothetical protein CEUSTIGMA_g4482.t1 [Chlamydomonas eustigma]